MRLASCVNDGTCIGMDWRRKVHEICRQGGPTRRELAQQLGVVESTLARWLGSRRNPDSATGEPSISEGKRLAEILGVDWKDLFDDSIDEFEVNRSVWIRGYEEGRQVVADIDAQARRPGRKGRTRGKKGA